mmetsp:Transcript_3514/g.10190  ORF Transcript_3514/g.10190 Transcript_3514/m.10190 type:complete len:256 (-) Transcript_3514:578-1345(-)
MPWGDRMFSSQAALACALPSPSNKATTDRSHTLSSNVRLRTLEMWTPMCRCTPAQGAHSSTPRFNDAHSGPRAPQSAHASLPRTAPRAAASASPATSLPPLIRPPPPIGATGLTSGWLPVSEGALLRTLPASAATEDSAMKLAPPSDPGPPGDLMPPADGGRRCVTAGLGRADGRGSIGRSSMHAMTAWMVSIHSEAVRSSSACSTYDRLWLTTRKQNCRAASAASSGPAFTVAVCSATLFATVFALSRLSLLDR